MKSKLLTIFTFILAATAYRAAAQISFIPNTGYRFSIGASAGAAIMWGDLDNRKITPIGVANLEYRVKEFITIGLQAQMGSMEAGVKGALADKDGRYPKTISYGLYSKNSFQAFNVNGKVAIGQFNKTTGGANDYINGVYVGVGVGIIRNDISDIVTKYPETKIAIKGITLTSTEVVIPINLGFSIDIPGTRFSGVFNIQQNYTTGEGIDGYDFGVSKVKDSYSVISLGIKYSFGGLL